MSSIISYLITSTCTVYYIIGISHYANIGVPLDVSSTLKLLTPGDGLPEASDPTGGLP